jgi:hypothetical protein
MAVRSAIYLYDVASPFHLVTPPYGWLEELKAWDAELVIFPSQTQPVYRLMRRAHHSGGLTEQIFKTFKVHPDTMIAIRHRLVAVTTIPKDAVRAGAARIVAQLRARDQWQFRDGDAVEDHMEAQEATAAARRDQTWKDDNRARHRAARVGYLHRTGARVSLIAPRRPATAISSSPTPAVPSGPVSASEV